MEQFGVSEILQWSKWDRRKKTMDKVALVKAEVQGEEWAAKIQACRESGMSVRSWCRENGIASKTYYYHLRKLREKLCEQIPVAVAAVPESNESVMRISAAGIRVDIYSSAPAEGIEAVIRALKC